MTTTTLPTEPGTYLFCGVRDKRHLSVRDIHAHRTRPELVRVHRKDGKLSYVGSDFFYTPEQVIGTWLRVTEETEALQTQAMSIIEDEVARNVVPRALTGSWGSSTPRGSVVYNLVGPFEESKPTAERLIDRAVEMGSIVPDPNWKGAYTLPGAPK